ncbi:hypothetical protein SCHPADRAFT_948437 [Schizopora paradoxa]|uniref:Uncharacterized protein n=1 Tax=Schizopora paradoxa TaxID=27342 RepID=A0A0H2R2J2_9AGAM|nr:hypothetical protein SCHPADRAFT_948437 [Schizopora paradoxa]
MPVAVWSATRVGVGVAHTKRRALTLVPEMVLESNASRKSCMPVNVSCTDAIRPGRDASRKRLLVNSNERFVVLTCGPPSGRNLSSKDGHAPRATTPNVANTQILLQISRGRRGRRSLPRPAPVRPSGTSIGGDLKVSLLHGNVVQQEGLGHEERRTTHSFTGFMIGVEGKDGREVPPSVRTLFIHVRDKVLSTRPL